MCTVANNIVYKFQMIYDLLYWKLTY
jgi:hypothetical protein